MLYIINYLLRFNYLRELLNCMLEEVILLGLLQYQIKA